MFRAKLGAQPKANKSVTPKSPKTLKGRVGAVPARNLRPVKDRQPKLKKVIKNLGNLTL
jgi:hypothetical protein